MIELHDGMSQDELTALYEGQCSVASIDIRDIDLVSSDNSLELSLADLVDELPIPEGLKSSLKDIARELEPESFRIIQRDELEVENREGRGRYSRKTVHGIEICTYTRGVGNSWALSEHPSSPLGMFGGEKRWMYDRQHNGWTPRVLGALYLENAKKNFLMSLYLFVNNVHNLGVSTIEELLDSRIPVPLNVARFGSLSRYLQENVPKNWLVRQVPDVGSDSAIVPSDSRASNLVYVDEIRNIAAGIVRLYKTCNAVFEPVSAHGQNFYESFQGLGPVEVVDDSTAFFGDQTSHLQRLPVGESEYSACPLADYEDLVVLPKGWKATDRVDYAAQFLYDLGRRLDERWSYKYAVSKTLRDSMATELGITGRNSAVDIANALEENRSEPHVTLSEISGLVGIFVSEPSKIELRMY